MRNEYLLRWQKNKHVEKYLYIEQKILECQHNILFCDFVKKNCCSRLNIFKKEKMKIFRHLIKIKIVFYCVILRI